MTTLDPSRESGMPQEEHTLIGFDLTRLLLGKLADGAMARVPILWMSPMKQQGWQHQTFDTSVKLR